MTWSHFHPTRVTFGIGALSKLPEVSPQERVVLVTTPGTSARGVTARVLQALGSTRVQVIENVTENPELRSLVNDVEAIRGDPTGVIAIGGGSALDSGKVIGVLLQSRRDGRAPMLTDSVGAGGMLPLVTVPTTAGTGSEVTPFATTWDFTTRRKSSVSGPGMFPTTALVDPELTLSLPESVTVSSGLDALSQGLEALWNRNSTGVTAAYAARAVRLLLGTMNHLSRNLSDLSLRARMMEASLLAGLAISATRTAIAHSISYPLTAHFGVPHGLACSFSLPEIIRFNTSGHHTRMSEIAEAVGMKSPEVLEREVEGLLLALEVGPRLTGHGFDAGELARLGPEMLTPGRADNNLRAVSVDEAVSIAQNSWRRLDN